MSAKDLPDSAKDSAEADVIIPEGHERGEHMTRSQEAFYRLLWTLVQVVARGYFRAKVAGKQNVPTTGAFIVAPVHRSNLDTPLVAAITSRRLRYMGKESMWKNKFGAWFFTAGGGFPVERGTADRAAMKATMEVLDRGEPMVMFPEGTRQSGPIVEELFDGPAYVACRTQVPVVPVGIGGTEEAMPKGRNVPPPRRLSLVVGEPMQPPAPPEGKDRVSRRAVKQFTEDLRQEIQRLFDEAQQLAGIDQRKTGQVQDASQE